MVSCDHTLAPGMQPKNPASTKSGHRHLPKNEFVEILHGPSFDSTGGLVDMESVRDILLSE